MLTFPLACSKHQKPASDDPVGIKRLSPCPKFSIQGLSYKTKFRCCYGIRSNRDQQSRTAAIHCLCLSLSLFLGNVQSQGSQEASRGSVRAAASGGYVHPSILRQQYNIIDAEKEKLHSDVSYWIFHCIPH